MNTQLRIAIAALAVVAAGYAGSAAAQGPVDYRTTFVSDTGEVIHCQASESGINSCGNAYVPTDYTVQPRATHCAATGSGRTYCGPAVVEYVAAGGERNPVCVKGVTWDVDEHGLWVSGDCSAYF